MTEYGDIVGVHLFSDTESAGRRLRHDAERLGCRVISELLVQSDPEGFRRVAPGVAALIELEGAAPTEQLIPLLDWAQEESAHGRRGAAIAMPRGLIDLVFARGPDLDTLCEARDDQRLAAFAAAVRPAPARFHDVGREHGGATLQQLSEDVGRIAAILASLSDEETAAQATRADEVESGQPSVEAPYIRAMIRARRLRDQYLRGELFADPAWDMLLDLMAARLERNRVAVSSLCIAAHVPATTALRWIKALTDRALLVRAADPQDGRRVYIGLSDETARALSAYFRAVQRICPLAV